MQAFVLHGSHSSATIYYAKLPHTHLSEIARCGTKYLQQSIMKERVKLRRTKKFHLHHTGERVELFQLLVVEIKKLRILVALIKVYIALSYKSDYTYNYSHDVHPISYVYIVGLV